MKEIQRVAIIGECMVELTKVDGKLKQGFGGDTLNTAVYLSRLTRDHGVDTRYITGLGRDPFSADMLRSWQEEGINTQSVHRSKDKLPGLYAIETDASGERQFFYWRNMSAARFWLEEACPDQVADELTDCQLIYLSGISLAILPEASRRKLFALLAECRQKGCVIAFDNNYRPALWDCPATAQSNYREMLALTDIAFLTFDDDKLLWGDEREQQSIVRAQILGVKEVVVKRGAEPCYIALGDNLSEVAAQTVENVVDTTAAGDSFSAGYLAKRLLGGTVEQAGQSGHSLAANVIQHRGAIIPQSAMPQR
ncbi:sugar kinase [Vibrio sonorensis]|uniref:sugar kinase n=1 Tax=Vibrio sonorensis TaxID=1004316 RepID=UPI0008DA2B2F|nr:sugar kinase [Vibrio sonorensis]